MSNSFKRVLATLDNGQSIYVYNADATAEFTSAVVLSSQPELRTDREGTEIYKFNHSASGWFASIKPTDTDRMANVLQLANEDIVIKITPIKSYSVNDIKSAKPFVGGN